MKKVSMNTYKSSLFLVHNTRLKKKSRYSRKVIYYRSELENLLIEKQKYKKLNRFLREQAITGLDSEVFLPLMRGVTLLYIVSFSFSAINTFLCVTDVLGTLKFSFSAGLLDFKGKSKKRRFQILKLFFAELKKSQLNFLKQNPVALNLNNVGSYKRFIVRKLKKKLFIKVIKNYQSYSYNGCRKKKKVRK